MANPHRGEVEFAAGGKTYTLRLNVNALIEVEGLGIEINDVSAMQRLGALRAVLWAGLRETHPGLDLAAVGEIMEEAGIGAAAQAVGRALQLAFPDPEPATTDRPL